MCAVSAVGDYYKNGFKDRWPQIYDQVSSPPQIFPIQQVIDINSLATKEDAEKIRLELAALKELLKAAIKFDEEASQPHCENEDKIALIKRIAEMVGVDLKDLDLS